MQSITKSKNSFCIQTFRDTITSICKFDILSYLSTIHTLYKALCYLDLVPGSGFTISLVITQRSLPNTHPVTEADSTLVLKHDSYLRKQRNNHLRDMTVLLLIVNFYVLQVSQVRVQPVLILCLQVPGQVFIRCHVLSSPYHALQQVGGRG